MGGSSSSAGSTKTLSRGEKYVEAKIAKIRRDIVEEGGFATMDIQEQPIRDLGVSKLADFLEEEGCKIDRLILRKNNATPVGMTRLVQTLCRNESLKELSIIDNKMGDQLPQGGQNVLERTVTGGASLVYGADAAHQLAQSLKRNRALQVLKLEENLLGNEGCEAIVEALKENTTLTDLTLQRNEIGDKGIKVVAKILLDHNISLSRLDLQENAITDEGADALCRSLERNTTLAEINLRANLLTAAMSTSLTSMLQVNTRLTDLNLRRNALKDEGCSLLAKALEQNSTIKRLFLSSNLIGCTGCATLGESLEKNTALEDLYLEINNIEDTGCIRFAEALEKNSTLKKVDLQMNNFGGLAYQRLSQAVERNLTLCQLKLSNSLMDSKEPVKHINAVLSERLSLVDQECESLEAVDVEVDAAECALEACKSADQAAGPEMVTPEQL